MDESPRIIYGWLSAACGMVLLFVVLIVLGAWVYDGGSNPRTAAVPGGSGDVHRYFGAISPRPTAISSCKYRTDKLIWGGCVVLAGKAPLTHYGIEGENFFCAYGDGDAINNFLAYAIVYCSGPSQ